MQNLDIRTMLFSFAVSNLLITLVMASLWRHNRRRFAGIAHWFFSYVLQALALLLTYWHGVIPDFFSIVISNAFILGSLLIFYMGMEDFLEEQSPQIQNYFLLAASIGFLYYFGLVLPNLTVRILTVSIAILLISFQCAWLLLIRVPRPLHSVTMAPGIVWIALTVTAFLRFFFTAVNPPTADHFLTNPLELPILLANEMLAVMLAFALVLMVNARLFLELQVFAAEKENLAQGLKHLANTDTLTGIFNRLRLDNAMTVEVYRAQRYKRALSVIMLDVDHFKAINDQHGHAVGDQVLQDLAMLIAKSTRETDIIGRWGGEEFLIISPETGLAEACKLAERLRSKIEVHSFGDVGHKTVSLGVAEFLENETREALLKRADAALYRAKKNGRNRMEH
jgi:diguanylate cyclase (GGDEF)-like protein